MTFTSGGPVDIMSCTVSTVNDDNKERYVFVVTTEDGEGVVLGASTSDTRARCTAAICGASEISHAE